MSAPPSGFDGAAALIPGELRGYRQFRLEPDGLYPLVHASLGPWAGSVQQAVCATGGAHAAPERSCGCGVYGWYHPDSAAGFVDQVSAVVTVQGRTILGERGFRAARARIDAVALPWTLGLRPTVDRRVRQMLTQNYPHAAVYRSRRRMVADYPAADLTALGIAIKPGQARRYTRLALALWMLVVVTFYAVLLLVPQGQSPRWIWLVVVLGIVGAQVAAVPLLARCGDRTGARKRPGDTQPQGGAQRHEV